MKIVLLATLFTTAFSLAAAGQVRVDIRPEKESFLEGEPVYFSVSITNIGEYPIGYGFVGRQLNFSVNGTEPYAWRTEDSCHKTGFVRGASSGTVDHPPLLAPGKTIGLRYLLRGFRLKAGTQEVQVRGNAPVRWFTERPPPGPGPVSQPIPHTPGDSVEGASIDRTVRVDVHPATESELQAVLADLFRQAKSYDGQLARDGIYEAANPQQVNAIAELLRTPESGAGFRFEFSSGYEALADIDTPAAWAALRRLFDDATDLRVREEIVRGLGRSAHIENRDFFLSLLPGRSTPADDRLRLAALYSLECMPVEGDAVAVAVSAAATSDDQYVRERAIATLGRTKSRLAVSAIVEAALLDVQLLSSSCEPLRVLTHYDWCDFDHLGVEPGPDYAKAMRPAQRRWQDWWEKNKRTLRVYGPAEAPAADASLPKVR